MAFAGIFPGQGSQSVGMLSGLAASFPVVRQTFEEASDALGLDLWTLTQDGSAVELNKTVNTQPAMLTAGIATWRVWQAQGGGQPVALAGHSLGEYSALVAAEAIPFTDAVMLVRTRAALMQQAVPEGAGAMAAILGLDDDEVIKVCADAAASEIVQAVNFNSPGQVVIAGNKEAVARAMALATKAGARRVIDLPVSVPSHCDLMKSAAEQLASHLQEVSIHYPDTPVFHNVDAATATDAAGIREVLAEQLYRPVKWVDSIHHLKQDKQATKMIEFGPGKVLFGLNRRIDKGIKTICVQDNASLDKALQLVQEKEK